MAMTETSPVTDQTPAAAAGTVAPAPVDPAGLAGWLSTSDHKRVGRLWIVTSLVFLLAGGVLGELLGTERLSSGVDVLKNGTFAQVSTLHSEAAVLLFLVPFFLGLATYLVPLQVGSPEIAFPRGSATAFWGYVVGGLLLCGSYVADGGITGTTSTSIDLYLLSIVLIAASLALGAVSAVTTALTMRAPGLDLLDIPLFSWATVIGGGLLLLELPVLASRAIELFVQHHYGNEIGSYRGISAFWSLPGTTLLTVMAAGVLLEVVPAIAGRALRFHAAGVIVLGAMGVLGIGGWVLDPKATDDLLYVGVGLAAVIPALALLGLLADTARAGAPKLKAPLVLALASALLLLAGAAAGGLEVIDPLHLIGTTWQAGQIHLALFGGGTLAAFAALWFWAPKIWGQHLSERAGFLVALLVLGGAVLLAVPDLVTGAAEDQPRAAVQWDSSDTVTTSNAISVAGGGLGALGAIVAIGAVASAAIRKRGVPAIDSPWGGWTLEWRTSSPPPPHNFEETPDVTERAGA